MILHYVEGFCINNVTTTDFSTPFWKQGCPPPIYPFGAEKLPAPFEFNSMSVGGGIE